MILPIIAFGDPVLREKTEEIGPDYPHLDKLIRNMYETMYNASGVGLAAPQVGLSIRLFIVDGKPMGDDDDPMEDFKMVFINPRIVEEVGERWAFEEGCLSIPDIREKVEREPRVRIQWMNEKFEPQEAVFDGLRARIIQHEYDHLEGVLFTDYVKGLKKQLLKSRLARISKGNIKPAYPMRFQGKRNV